MFKKKVSIILILVSITLEAQTCWKKTVTNDNVYILQEKYDAINDTMCVIVYKDDSLNCESLKKIKAMKPILQDGFISKLIAKGYRVEIYRKTEIFN
ncbi:MAG: hypothetical protein WCJ62_00330 [Flavobacterium sp.]